MTKVPPKALMLFHVLWLFCAFPTLNAAEAADEYTFKPLSAGSYEAVENVRRSKTVRLLGKDKSFTQNDSVEVHYVLTIEPEGANYFVVLDPVRVNANLGSAENPDSAQREIAHVLVAYRPKLGFLISETGEVLTVRGTEQVTADLLKTYSSSTEQTLSSAGFIGVLMTRQADSLLRHVFGGLSFPFDKAIRENISVPAPGGEQIDMLQTTVVSRPVECGESTCLEITSKADYDLAAIVDKAAEVMPDLELQSKSQSARFKSRTLVDTTTAIARESEASRVVTGPLDVMGEKAHVSLTERWTWRIRQLPKTTTR